MRRPRGIFGLSLTAAASMSVIALYQMGISGMSGSRACRAWIRTRYRVGQSIRIPETPDSVLAIGSYATTMALAAMGPPDRAESQPLLPLPLTAKVALDASVAAKYTVDEWKTHRAFCFWCIVASAATFASVPLAIPEARRALRTLL